MTIDKFGDLNRGDLFRYYVWPISNGGGGAALPVFRKACPRTAVQQRADGKGDMHTIDAVVRTKPGTKVVRVVPEQPQRPQVRFGAFDTIGDLDDLRPQLQHVDAKVTQCNYSIVVSSAEWELVVMFTGRQDGRFAWCVLLVQVDDNIRHLNGLTPYATTHDAVNTAILQLTRSAGWIVPLNLFAETRA